MRKPNTKRTSVTLSAFTQCPAVAMMSGATRKPEQNAPVGWSRKRSPGHRLFCVPKLTVRKRRRAVAVVGHAGGPEQGDDAVGIVAIGPGGKLEHLGAVVDPVDQLLAVSQNGDDAVIAEVAQVLAQPGQGIGLARLAVAQLLQQGGHGQVFQLHVGHVSSLLASRPRSARARRPRRSGLRRARSAARLYWHPLLGRFVLDERPQLGRIPSSCAARGADASRSSVHGRLTRQPPYRTC